MNPVHTLTCPEPCGTEFPYTPHPMYKDQPASFFNGTLCPACIRKLHLILGWA